MTTAKVKETLTVHQFSDEFKNLVSYKHELACLKSLIKALGYRIEQPEFLVLLEELSRITLNGVINECIKLVQNTKVKAVNRNVAEAITGIDMSIKALSGKIEKLIIAVATAYISKEVTEESFTLINEVLTMVQDTREDLKKANIILAQYDF